jgi:FAD/FMN-containing dehydrogenase
MTPTTAAATLLDGFRGSILHPHDEGYDEVRRVWNGAVDRRPALIARCTSTDDVAAAVQFAVRHDLIVAVRGGGHSIPGHSVCDGGVLIDLSTMKSVEVDPEQRRAQVQPGVLLGELDAATGAHGLASPGGEISHTGVAGLTLGGGVGWLSRMYGLACDTLVAAEVVTAAGEVLEVTTDTDPELMWGLRGGGGNFGVVTRFTFALHPVQPMLAGGVMLPLQRGREAFLAYRDLCAEAPDELSVTLAAVCAPPAPFVPPELVGRPVLVLGMAWVGDVADGEPWADRLRGLEPAVDLLGVMPYPALQSMVDDGAPHGRGYHVKSEWLANLDDESVDALVQAVGAMKSPYGQILLRQLGGAIARVDAAATAVSFRDAAHLLTVVGAWGVGEEPASHVAWARATWDATRHNSSGGGYVNQLDADEGVDRVRAAYGEPTWTRLVALKSRLDPTNVFRLNQNVPPG